MKAGCATLVALNKWDLGGTDLDDARARRRAQAAPAPAGGHLLGESTAATSPSCCRGRSSSPTGAAERIPTPELNRFVADVVAQPPAAVEARQRLRLYYAAQVGSGPPRIAIQVNDRRLITATGPTTSRTGCGRPTASRASRW